MENSIEEDIKDIKKYISFTSKRENFSHDADWNWNKDLANKIEHILSAYKRVLKELEEKTTILLAGAEKVKQLEKENEELKADNYELNNRITDLLENIPIQKVKDIIDRIDYDIKKTKEIISKNTNIYASYRKNDYQIVRLKAMNTKSLDIKKRLQELLESEE